MLCSARQCIPKHKQIGPIKMGILTLLYYHLFMGYAVAQLVEALRYKPGGSIPDGVTGIFH
jgi:hypothetical protein